MEITPEQISIAEVIEDAFRDRRHRWKPKVSVSTRARTGRTPGGWCGCVERLKPAGDAIRYSPTDGMILVQLRQKDGRAVMTVADEGPGVSDTMKERLFERFVTDRKEPNQTGLGLAIVRTVAELHDGSVVLLDSDQGACFELSLGNFRLTDEKLRSPS